MLIFYIWGLFLKLYTEFKLRLIQEFKRESWTMCPFFQCFPTCRMCFTSEVRTHCRTKTQCRTSENDIYHPLWSQPKWLHHFRRIQIWADHRCNLWTPSSRFNWIHYYFLSNVAPTSADHPNSANISNNIISLFLKYWFFFFSWLTKKYLLSFKHFYGNHDLRLSWYQISMR